MLNADSGFPLRGRVFLAPARRYELFLAAKIPSIVAGVYLRRFSYLASCNDSHSSDPDVSAVAYPYSSVVKWSRPVDISDLEVPTQSFKSSQIGGFSPF